MNRQDIANQKPRPFNKTNQVKNNNSWEYMRSESSSHCKKVLKKEPNVL